MTMMKIATIIIKRIKIKRKDEDDNIADSTNVVEEGGKNMLDIKEENKDPEYMQGYI